MKKPEMTTLLQNENPSPAEANNTMCHSSHGNCRHLICEQQQLISSSLHLHLSSPLSFLSHLPPLQFNSSPLLRVSHSCRFFLCFTLPPFIHHSIPPHFLCNVLKNKQAIMSQLPDSSCEPAWQPEVWKSVYRLVEINCRPIVPPALHLSICWHGGAHTFLPNTHESVKQTFTDRQ